MKKIRKIGGVLILTMGLTLLGGCGNKSNKKILNDTVDKYSQYCTLGDYKGIEYNESKTEVDEDLVNSQIESLLSNYATSEEITTGTVQDGDIVNIDYVGSIDGVEFDGGNTFGAGYDLTIGSGSFIDDFEDQIIGHSIGDEFDVNVTFPEDYGATDLAGKDAVFAVTLNSIQRLTYPEYTDEFVSTYTEYSTVEEYEKNLRDNLAKSYAENDDWINKTTLLEKATNNAEISEYPKQEMEDYIDEQIESIKEEAAQYGYDVGTYISVYSSFSSEAEFRDYLGESFEAYIRQKIVVCAIAKAENITLSNDEITEYKKVIMEDNGLSNEKELEDIYTQEEIIYLTLRDKVAGFLVENAVPEVATGTDAE